MEVTVGNDGGKQSYLNDIFYLTQTCDLTNYSDDNTLHHIASIVEADISAIRTVTNAAIDWFIIIICKQIPLNFNSCF